MTFSMQGDNVAHALFNIWRLPRLLRLCNIKIQLSNFHNPKHITKNFHTQKQIYIYIYINTPPLQNQINAPPKCRHYQIYHISIEPPNFTITMQKENFYMSKKKFPQLHAQINSHIPNKIFPQYLQNLPISINIYMHIPIKFCHVHKTKFTHAHKFSHIHHEHIHTSQTQFSQCQYSQNPNQSSSNNITKYLHCQNSNSHQHFPNCTMIKEKTHFKNAPKPTFQT